MSTKWVQIRRAKLAEIIASDPRRDWSVREMAIAMRNDPTVMSRQPSYSKSTAHLDWLAIRDELAEKRIDLASGYIVDQLDVTGEIMDDLMYLWREINNIDLEAIEDRERAAELALEIVKEKVRLVSAIDKMMERQQSLVPIAVPKRLEVDERKFVMNIDTFLQYQREAAQISDVIEGEVVHSDNGIVSQ